MAKYLNEILEKAYKEIYFSEQSFHNFSKLKEYLEYKEDVDLICEHKLIKNIGNFKYQITPLGRRVYKGIGAEKHLEKDLKEKYRSVIKKRNDFKLSKWKVLTFWPLFIIAISSSFYSLYDFFIKTPSTEKDVIELKQTIKQMELDKSKQNISSLNQTFSDSLNYPNSEIDTLNH